LRTFYNFTCSQIKLTSYDISNLHITGEFDNRPGTGRFWRFFSCVFTYRTGANQRLYMTTLLPCRRCKRYGVRPILHGWNTFLRNDVYKKDWDWLWHWWRCKPYLNKTAKNNSPCSLHVTGIHYQLLKRNIYFCIYVLVLILYV